MCSGSKKLLYRERKDISGETRAMRCGLPMKLQCVPPTKYQNCSWKWTQEMFPTETAESMDTVPCYCRSWSVIFIMRLIYGKTIMFEVKWPVIGYNHIRCLLEALISSLLN